MSGIRTCRDEVKSVHVRHLCLHLVTSDQAYTYAHSRTAGSTFSVYRLKMSYMCRRDVNNYFPLLAYA
jgi:hypothetical protein